MTGIPVSFADLDAPDRKLYPNLYRMYGLAKMHGLDTGFGLHDWVSWRAGRITWRIATLTIGSGPLEKNGWGVFGSKDADDAYCKIMTQDSPGHRRRTNAMWHNKFCSIKATMSEIEQKLPEWGVAR